MKTIHLFKLLSISLITAALAASCIKSKPLPPVNLPIPPANENEVITTVSLHIKDSATNTVMVKTFSDPDGDGAQPGVFANNGIDSMFVLQPNKTYFCTLYFLDATKSPVDTLSKAIAGDESYVHMIFYNGDPAATGNYGNTIFSAHPNYGVKLNGSNVRVFYKDLDNGPAFGYVQRNIGLSTRLRTDASPGTGLFPFRITLRHQPGVNDTESAKDGTYTPGSTDVEITFKVGVF